MRLGIRSRAPWTVSGLFDRLRFAPRGYRGGADGARGEFVLSDGTCPDPKIQQVLSPATELVLRLPGGGGFWSPLERDLEAVLADVVGGYVSIEAAERDYGVVIRCRHAPEETVRLADDYELDREASERLRSAGGLSERPASLRQGYGGPPEL
jgi:N-methylhydantoinase B